MEYTVQHGIEILERTPKILESFLKDLSDDWIMCNEGPDTWTAFDIVGHLIHGERTDWTQRLKIILSDDPDKTFTPFDRFAQFESSKGKSMHDLIEEFKKLRSENLNFFKSLKIQQDQFNLKAIHPSLGEVTLKELLASWVAHDLGHIAQISRVMAKQYKDEVGPWNEYLTVLHR